MTGTEAVSLPLHELVRKLGGWAEIAREFCYRLYTVCERKKRAAGCAGLQRTGAELAGDKPSRQNGGTPGAGRAVRRWGCGGYSMSVGIRAGTCSRRRRRAYEGRICR